MLPGINQFNLTGRTALITGGSKGLGLAMAEGLASAGLLLQGIKASYLELQLSRNENMYFVEAVQHGMIDCFGSRALTAQVKLGDAPDQVAVRFALPASLRWNYRFRLLLPSSWAAYTCRDSRAGFLTRR